jgi:hypothetical protein
LRKHLSGRNFISGKRDKPWFFFVQCYQTVLLYLPKPPDPGTQFNFAITKINEDLTKPASPKKEMKLPAHENYTPNSTPCASGNFEE